MVEIEIDIKELDKDMLIDGAKKVIDCLKDFPIAYKIGVLHYLMETFPVKYTLVSVPDEDEDK